MLIAVDFGIHIGSYVVDIAVIFPIIANQTPVDTLGQRPIERAAQPIFIACRIRRLSPAASAICGALGDDVHHASRGVFAEQCPLRPAQNLNPININQISKRLTGAAVHDAINDG